MKKTLLAETAGKYQVLEGHGVGEYHWKGYPVHIDQVNLAEADRLVADGFPYLVALPAKKQKALE